MRQRIHRLRGGRPGGFPGCQDQLHWGTAPDPAVWGEHDRTIPPVQADLLASSVPQGRKSIIAGGSHAPSISDPVFNAELLKFVAESAPES